MLSPKQYAWWIVGALCLALLSGSCGNQANGQGMVNAEELKQLIDDPNPQQVVLDIRTPDEVAKGVISGAVHLDFYQSNFQEQLDKLDRNKTYYVYCHIGGRSAKAANQMAAMGFKSVFDVEGGIVAWKKEGYELVEFAIP